ncbi:aldo/keto reductase [Streptomyces sp. NPDC058459]|uniref:aldo/keto reductase n=1 Tax=Streptomyces sp. NPDC058459 TaxID=3346508 RepID=UPI003649A14E
MRYLPLGSSGLTVSQLGLGCSNFGARLDADASGQAVEAALDAGVTFFDTADIYGNGGYSEKFLGSALKGRRDQVVIATKFGWGGIDMGYGPAAGAPGGRSYIRRAVEGSLRRLGTDYIDLYQIHTPDPVTPVSETLAALSELVTEGKVRYIGSSNYAGWQIALAEHTARELGCTAYVSAQNEWSVLDRRIEAEVVPAASHYGIGIIPCWPLANGLLTGKYRTLDDIPANSRFAGMGSDYVTPEKLAVVNALADWAERQGRTSLEVALGYLAGQPTCGPVIAGAMSPKQVEQNASALEWVPTPAELQEIEALATLCP